jgi:hypothetical protein
MAIAGARAATMVTATRRGSAIATRRSGAATGRTATTTGRSGATRTAGKREAVFVLNQQFERLEGRNYREPSFFLKNNIGRFLF